MKNKILILTGELFLLIVIFLIFPYKTFALSQGVGTWFNQPSDDGKSWRIVIFNTEEVHKKGEIINAAFVVYQCRSKRIDFDDNSPYNHCDGDSPDFVVGSREDVSMPGIALPGKDDGDISLGQKSFSKGFSCGRIQVDLAASGFDQVLGGTQKAFLNDCPAPTATPTPTPTITPTPTCVNESYTQCGEVVCNGATLEHKNVVRVAKKTCGSNITYVCTNLGPLPGQCDNPGPTPTPTRPAPPTSTPTQSPSGVPTATATSAAPTATPTTLTPTPGFSNAMCKCDGITTSGIFQGQNAVVNTFAKVEGNDITAARVTSMTYNFGVATARNPNLVTPLISPVPIAPVIVENTSSKVRYQTTFRFLVPTPPANNPLYRVWVNINCAKKTAQSTSPSQVVLSASTKNDGGLLNSIKDAFSSISSTVQAKIKEVLGITNAPPSLQLAPIYPAQVSREYCSSFWFQFKNP